MPGEMRDGMARVPIEAGVRGVGGEGGEDSGIERNSGGGAEELGLRMWELDWSGR